MKIIRFALRTAVLAAVFSAAAGITAWGRQADEAASISAQIDKARDLLRDGEKYAETLDLLSPVRAQVLSVPDEKQRIDLSAEIFLLCGMAEAGLGDEKAALREFRSLYALSADVARTATKNVFDPKIIPLLKRIEREISSGNEAVVPEIDSEPTANNPRPEAETRAIAAKYGSVGFWGGLENALLKSPVVIGRGIPGEWIVGDSSDSKLKKFDENGTVLWEGDPGLMAELGVIRIGGLTVEASGNIIFSDPENHVVFQLRPDGGMLTKWGSFGQGPGEFNTPLGLAVDEDGWIYIADSGNNRIQIRTSEGIPIQTWGGSGGKAMNFDNPRAVVVRGSLVYILDSRRVQVFNRDGVPGPAWELKGPEGESVPAGALAVDREGCLYLADPKGQRVLKYDSAGRIVCVWGQPGIESGEFGNPVGLAVDDRGRIYVVENENHRVQIFEAKTGAAEGNPEFRRRSSARDRG